MPDVRFPSSLDRLTPEILTALLAEQRPSAVEDLSLCDARFPSAVSDVTVDEVRGLLTTLAALHARFWGSPALHAQLNWLATPVSGGKYPVFQAHSASI
ncbi:MAG: hypothetical protein OEV36_07070 [Myxococcales bacterium]|nr:hypothetical protein [Myxococcales bacterium]